MTESTVAPTTALVEKCSAVLLDVAGTTTSLNFVKDTLFPYFTNNVEQFLKEKWDNLQEHIKALQEEELDLEKATKLVKELTEQNSENVGLKALQGLLYKQGYASGDLKGHVFEEVPECFESWSKTKKLAIFSTGSIESQKLLFSSSVKGDLSAHITEYFDNSIGSKNDKETYTKIAEALKLAADEILFLTDKFEEATAAKEAQMSVFLVTREGNEALTEEQQGKFTEIKSFKDISFENPAKRKTTEDEAEKVEEAPPSKVAKTEEASAEVEAPTEVAVTETKMEVDSSETAETKTETESTEAKAETKEAEAETEPKAETEAKTEEAVEAESSEKAEEEVKEEAKAEEKTDEVDKPVEAEKTEAVEEKVEEVATEAEPKENGAVVEEKENQSELANGVENSDEKKNGEEKTNGEEASTVDEEVKVKKLPEPVEATPPVAVEV